MRTIRSDNVARHMRIHGGVKKFACDQCNYQTLRKYDLKRHKKSIHWKKENTRAMDDEKIQNGIKKSRVNVKNNKFQCNLCEYGSDRNWLVKRHMKLIHWKNKKIVGERKTIQNRNGNETSNDYVRYIEEELRKNLMKDVVDNKYQCNLCDYGSERRRNVARHMKLIHEKNKNAVGESKIIQDRNGNETPNENVGDNKEGFRKNLMKESLEEEEKSNLGSKIYIININI